VIVLDASAAVLALLNDGDARRTVARETVVVPHLVDAEVANALRAQVRRRNVGTDEALAALVRWARLGLRRFAVHGLMTADARLAKAPGVRCAITVVRR